MMLRLPLHDHYAGAMSQNERELAADLAKRVAEDDAADVAEGDEALAHDGGRRPHVRRDVGRFD